MRLLPLIVGFTLLASIAGCEPQTDPTVDTNLTRGDLPELEVPPIDGIDFAAAYEAALAMALTVNAKTPWVGHRQVVAEAVPGCPDFYFGGPPEELFNSDIDGDAPGLAWADRCEQPSGQTYNGYAYWETTLRVNGDPTTAQGQTIDGTRSLEGSAAVGDSTGIFFGFRGRASDSLFRSRGDGYDSWRYNSRVTGTVEGTDLFAGTSTPRGWRTDLNTVYLGGDTERLELRGNGYFFDGRIDVRFDSFNMDIAVITPSSAGPDDCTLEPLGFIGLRDENAYWYDLVFLPRYDNDITDTPYPNDPLAACDGCGTLYIRGVKQDTPVCPDFMKAFDGTFQPPTAADFIASLRDLPMEAP